MAETTTAIARIDGVSRKRAGWIARIGFWFARRKVGRVPIPMTIAAHNKAVFRAYCGFEMGIQKARAVSEHLRALASVKTGALVGCVW
jgi:hypothetical protein